MTCDGSRPRFVTPRNPFRCVDASNLVQSRKASSRVRGSARLSGSEEREAGGEAYNTITMMSGSRAQFRNDNGRRAPSRTSPTVGQRRGPSHIKPLVASLFHFPTSHAVKCSKFQEDHQTRCWLVWKDRLVSWVQ